MNNKPINLNVLRTLTTTDALMMLGQEINSLAAALQTGSVWENRVEAQRNIENVIVSLPANVQAAMIEEEAQKAQNELGEILNEKTGKKWRKYGWLSSRLFYLRKKVLSYGRN